jgi:RNA polymerase sigma-70 factor (ECF subfamily)
MSVATVLKASESVAPEFEQIFREHCQLVYRTAYTVTGSHQDAEDVLQNIFVKLLERQHPPDLNINPRGYLYRAAVNMSLRAIRTRKRQRLTYGVEHLEAVSPTDELDTDETRRRELREALAKLRPRAVEIVILRYEHGYSDAEIATMLGRSRGVIAVTLNRARARLKKLLRASWGGTHES